jgi:hypothetical protein
MLSKRQTWAMVAGVTGVAAAQVTEHLMTSSWRLAARRDPPADPAYEDVDWKSAVLWTVSAGAVAALTQMMARRGAGAVWKRVTGQTPPRTRRRKRLRSARAAVFG